jgi:hypothetical protein
VADVDGARGTVSIDTDRGERLELNRRYLDAGHVRHAYALTGHSGQGMTVQRAFVLGSGGARLQEWGYVALSRARDTTRLYITGVRQERESHFHELDDRAPATVLAQALEESATERLAVDQQPLPDGPLHGTRVEIRRRARPGIGSGEVGLIRQERLATLRLRQRVDSRLNDALRELAQLGPFQRRRRAELHAQVAVDKRERASATSRLEWLQQQEATLTCRRNLPDRGRIVGTTEAHPRAVESGLEI